MKRFLFAVIVLLVAAATATAQVKKAPQAYVNFTVLADKSDCTYAVGEAATLSIYAKAAGNGLEGVPVTFALGEDRMEADTRGTTYFKNGIARVEMGTMDRPGFRHCTIKFEVEGESYTETVKVGYGIGQIEPTITDAPDFDLFWKRVLKEARRTPLVVEEKPLENYTSEQITVSEVRIPIFEDGSCIYGCLSVPNDGKKHPVLFVPPGAGVKRVGPSNIYAKAGFITLAIEVHGIPMMAPDSVIAREKAERGDYWFTGIEDRDTYYYKRIYAGCVRAIDYLMTHPQFDGRNVGVTGGSQGGALSIVTAALHPEVDFLASFYPALSDVSGYLHGRAGGWPRMFATPDAQPGIDRKKAVRTMRYYDVVNFARRIRCTGFYTYGFNDNTCPPTSVAAAFNVITAPKQVVATPANYHWRYPETHQQAIRWMQEQCE